MAYKDDTSKMSEKEYRRKLYEENKVLYKKVRYGFTYGVNHNFKQRRNSLKNEMELLEEETLQAYEEVE